MFTLVFCPGLSARSVWKYTCMYAFTQRFQKQAELGRMSARAELGSLFENEPSTTSIFSSSVNTSLDKQWLLEEAFCF